MSTKTDRRSWIIRSLRARVALLLVATGVFLVGGLVVNTHILTLVATEHTLVVSERLPQIEALNEALRTLREARSSEHDRRPAPQQGLPFIERSDAERRRSADQLEGALERYVAIAVAGDEKLETSRGITLLQMVSHLQDISLPEYDVALASDDPAVLAKGHRALGRSFAQTESAIQLAIDRECAEMYQASGEAATFTRNASSLIVLMAFVVLVAFGLYMSSSLRRIIAPVLALRNAAIAFGRGEHPPALPSYSVAELDALSSAFNEMVRARERAEQGNREARRHAEAANTEKSKFLANMSHEIRTPMTAILGFAETIADNVESPENAEAVATVIRNGEYLLGIINDILDLSKIEAGKLVIERIPCNPLQIIVDVIALLSEQADAKGLKLDVELIGRVPETIETDTFRLRQILINLVGNAIKFTDDGHVRLVVRLLDQDDASLLQIDVVDTGIGMTAEQREHVFHPFTQADSSVTRRFGGTGLGLTISRRLARMLGGDITIVDTEQDAGTTIRLTTCTGSIEGIALTDQMPDAPALTLPAARPAGGSTSLHGRRILLAEDGLDNQRLIALLLGNAGAEVVVHENGRLALEAALAARSGGKPFDCIVMDMQMPVMGGHEATTALRDAGYDGPIIALTASAMEGEREKCIDAGCDDFASKPIDRATLVDLVARHCSGTAAAA